MNVINIYQNNLILNTKRKKFPNRLDEMMIVHLFVYPAWHSGWASADLSVVTQTQQQQHPEAFGLQDRGLDWMNSSFIRQCSDNVLVCRKHSVICGNFLSWLLSSSCFSLLSVGDSVSAPPKRWKRPKGCWRSIPSISIRAATTSIRGSGPIR